MTRIGAVDIGTVTTRLFVADVTGSPGAETVADVERSTDITHLGEGLTASGSLSPAAMGRVAETIARYAATMESLGTDATMAVATSASRDASNRGEFLRLLNMQGVKPVIISGQREAELSFAGAAFGRVGDNVLVVDIGGGSTELILGDARPGRPASGGGVRHVRSIDVGSRRLTEMFLTSDPPRDDELAAASSFAEQSIAGFFATAPESPSEMISVAGTATTIAAILLGMPTPEYDPARVHGLVLRRDDIVATTTMLARLPLAQREGVVGLHPGRAPVIVAGMLVLLAVLDAAGLDSTLVSERDILYGMVLDTYRRLQ